MTRQLNGGAPIVAALALIVGAGVTHASDIIYQVDVTDLGIFDGAVTGTIETDGAIGALSSSDILSWNLELSEVTFDMGVPVGTRTFDLTGGAGGNSAFSETGAGLTATPTELLYDFGMTGVDGFVDGMNSWQLIGDSTGMDSFDSVTVAGFTTGPPEGTNTRTIATANPEVTATPEPGTFGLVLLALGSVIAARKRFTI